MKSALHTGHLPGVVKRDRFLNKKLHLRQRAGSTIILAPGPSERSTWTRWSYTSFSVIASARAISRAVQRFSRSISAIRFRMVKQRL